MTADTANAPGWPGLPPRWTSAAKSGAGTALGDTSRVWFTVSHGILNEVSYPRVDQACTRDLGLIVTDGRGFFSEEKRHADHVVACLADGVPAFQLTNRCTRGRYLIEKDVLTDPQRDTLLQHVRFTPLQGALADYHLHALLAPHLANRGAGNTAWVGDYKGVPMLFAERDRHALALACSAPWLQRSAGFVGASDGWQDLTQHGVMTWHYDRAEDGNVALMGEIDIAACGGDFLLALAFGRTAAEAGQQAYASVLDGFAAARDSYIRDWQSWLRTIRDLPVGAGDPCLRDLCRTSATVMRTHEAKQSPVASIAGLATPWGQTKGDDDVGGYHLVWPRDLVETAGGLLAAGAKDDVHRMLHFLEATQEADGHWPQNMWLDGTPYWTGIQMDETAFPILLVEMARRDGALESDDGARFWTMTRRAAAFIVANGPVSPQDRWEEDPGLSPFTLAVEIAALLAAADQAEANGEPSIAGYLRETADAWNDGIERWTYVSDTSLAHEAGVDGYYVRIAPPDIAEAASLNEGWVPIKNRPVESSSEPAQCIVSPDALALVRFGLRAADDPRIVDTVTVIDKRLKVETPYGPAWHRYNGDGYGEHEDGSPFDGTGVGRAWPLLTGERAHYELAAGRRVEAVRLLHTMEAFAGDGGLLPEQVWDAADVPDHELYFGRPSGSAMPLVWAHAEYIKLRRSLADNRVFDMPLQTVQRYLVDGKHAAHVSWRLNHKCRTSPVGRTLRIEVTRPALVHWSADDWQTAADMETIDTGMGMWIADLPTSTLGSGMTVRFTLRWTEDERWEGTDFAVELAGAWHSPTPPYAGAMCAARARTLRTEKQNRTRAARPRSESEYGTLDRGTNRRERWIDVALAGLIAAATVLVYSQVRVCQFVALDDPQYVTANPHVRAGLTWAGVQWAFTTMHDGNWFPLTWLSHMAVVQAFGLDSGFHHLANLALHLLSALLLFTALRRMTGARWPSALVALLFGIHPQHVESVAWVAERKDVLGGLFWMLAFNGYAHYVRRPDWRRYVLVAVPFVLGLLSKSMIVTLPFVLLLLDVWPLGRVRPGAGMARVARRLVWEKVPLLALAAAIATITYIAQQGVGAVAPLERIQAGLRASNAIVSYVAYIASFFWPSGLAVFYPYEPALAWWRVALSAAALAAVFVFALRRLAGSPYLAVGWAWFLGTLVPVIGFVQVGSQARADRYTYIPAIGLSIMLAWGTAEVAGRRPWTRLPLAGLAVVFSVACAVVAWSQVQVWRTSTALFEHALAVTSDNFVALDGVGLELRLQGHLDEAIGYLRDAVRVSPVFAIAQNNLGEALLARGRAEEALPHLIEAVRLNPTLREARVSLALTERSLGRADQALATYEDAVRRFPDYANAQTRLGMALAEHGRIEEGLAHMREAVRLAPDDPDAHYNLGRALLGTGNVGAAVAEFNETLTLHPGFAEGHFNLGNVLAGQGRFDDAMTEYRAAIRLQPDFARAHANLGTALATVGHLDEAITEFSEALRLQPDMAEVRANLDYARSARRR